MIKIDNVYIRQGFLKVPFFTISYASYARFSVRNLFVTPHACASSLDFLIAQRFQAPRQAPSALHRQPGVGELLVQFLQMIQASFVRI